MTEKFLQNESISEKLKNFRIEIGELKKHEDVDVKEGGGRKTAYFENIDPGELQESDADIYYKFRDGRLFWKELIDYKHSVRDGNLSQKNLAAYFSNMFMIKHQEEFLKED